jgi:predicted TIM-barrel fold metal-dependent hydrolase
MKHSPILTRRDVCKAGLLGFAGLTTGTTASATKTSRPRGWIDAHSHIWTRDTQSFPLATGQTVNDLDPPSFTTEELLQAAEEVGVDRVVLIQHHTYHGWDNSYMLDAAQRFPDRFRVTGMVDDTMPHPDRRMRKLLKQHVTALRITSWIGGTGQWLASPGMAAMWKCAADTRQAMACLINPEDLPAVDRMCRKHPDTPVVIDHFARIGVDGTIREKDLNNLCQLAKHKHTFAKLSAFYALGKKQPPYDDLIPMIRRVYEAFGPRRLMWASDAPYQVVAPHTYGASLALVRDNLDFLSADEQDWVLRRTAERVYSF